MPPKHALERASSYSVAWIAALAHERAAALVLLDERHDRPKDFTKNDSDQNSYSWGRIGDHNVVIASLPAGEYGTVSAADTTNGLRASLPHIRIGLLVGIGAGLTGEHVGQDGKIAIENEILLGDVVVSVPDGTNGGVVQHDFYKAKIEAGKQAHERIGFLNAAPRALRSAVSALQAEHELEESQIEGYLLAFENHTKMKAQYAFPGSDKDRIRRLLRTNTGNDIRNQPAIHYGTIVSGNSLVKSSAVRDDIVARLQEENINPLCLEMEAAGLMNTFPCIVIRGVCDYADEHKNEEWQRYAAATAAAFAKELLTYVDSAEINKERALGEVLDNIHHDVRQIIIDTTEVHIMLSESERREVLSWLCSVDYAQLYNAYSTTRVPHTGDWLLERSEFQHWLSSGDTPVLYCPGSPGAGKTFLATRIIDHLFNMQFPPKAAVIYLYCEHSRHAEQNLAHFLSCLLRQLAHAANTMPRSVQDLHATHNSRNTRPTDAELFEALRTVAMQEFEIVYVIVDALDECDTKTRRKLVKHLQALAQVGVLRLLATSRLIPDIDDLFCQEMQLRLEADDQDIREYVQVRTTEIQERLLFPEDVFNLIIGKITHAVHGMFLLARLHMDTLESKNNIRDIRDALFSLPDDSNGAYQAAMARINNQDEGRRSLAKQVLMWVVCAERPLSATELQHAISIRNGDKIFRKDGLTRIELFIDVCAGLVVLRDSGLGVHLAHYTAQEYFDRTWEDWFPKAELAITRSCLSYLVLKEFETGPCDDNVQLQSRLREYPFLEYAAQFWGLHAARLKTAGDVDTQEWNVLQGAVAPFLLSPTLCDATIQILLGSRSSRDAALTPRQSTACHIFGRFGLLELCEYCHDVGIDVSAVDSEGNAPFYYAIEAYEACLDDHLLPWPLRKPDMSKYRNRALWDAEKTRGNTLLSWTRQTDMAKYGTSALWYAVRHQDHQVIAKVLASDSINPNSKMFGTTPLIWAADLGHTRTVQTFVSCPRVDVNAVNDDGENALFCAIKKESSDAHRDDILTAILSAHDVVVDCCDSVDSTPLWYACEGGHISTVRLLVEKGSACPIKQNKHGLTPWLIAAIYGRTEIMEILLDFNASALNSRDGSGRSALFYAAEYGHVTVLDMLLSRRGTDINASDNDGETALMVPAKEGQNNIVSMLLEKDGIQINHQDAQGATALWHACRFRFSDLSTARILCQYESVDMNVPDCKGRTPLMQAIMSGETDVMTHLARCNNIDVNLKDKFGRTALWYACDEGHYFVALLLAEKNPSNLFAFDMEGCSPLSKIDKITGYELPDFVLVPNASILHRRDTYAEIKRCDPDRFDDPLKWTCKRLVANAKADPTTIHHTINLVHASGYVDFAAYCRELDPHQASCILRFWGAHATCNRCGVSNLTKCWCCSVDQQLICGECVESGFWCTCVDDLFEISATWYSDFPRFTGRRRPFDSRLRKKLEYWQGLILCNICLNDASTGYHCRSCLDDHFDICESCVFEEWCWCYASSHALKKNNSRTQWVLNGSAIGVNLADVAWQDLSAIESDCDLCAASMTRGFWCELCDDVNAICFECTKDGRWCNDRSHLLQEYDNDAISYPWRSYEEIRSPRRKSFDGQCRFPSEKPKRKRRYSFSDAGEVTYGELWSFERWAGQQLPYAATSDDEEDGEAGSEEGSDEYSDEYSDEDSDENSDENSDEWTDDGI